jgi:hypothetical protein
VGGGVPVDPTASCQAAASLARGARAPHPPRGAARGRSCLAWGRASDWECSGLPGRLGSACSARGSAGAAGEAGGGGSGAFSCGTLRPPLSIGGGARAEARNGGEHRLQLPCADGGAQAEPAPAHRAQRARQRADCCILEPSGPAHRALGARARVPRGVLAAGPSNAARRSVERGGPARRRWRGIRSCPRGVH